MASSNAPVAAPKVEPAPYDLLVADAKEAFKMCLKARGTKASREHLAKAVEALGKYAASEYI